jgi:DNA-binding transcriptional LysR family regulator
VSRKPTDARNPAGRANETCRTIRAVDLNLLKAFDAILTEGTVTGAGARIGLSQPAMSAALVRLRDLFNDRLFVRTPGGMEPTARARELAGPIQHALGEIEDALRNSPEFDPARARRTFVVGMTEYAEIALVEKLTERLRQQSDSIDLRLRSIAKVEYLELLDEGGIDAFVGHADGVPPRFLSASLLKDPLLLLARRGHPIFKTPITMEDLVKWPQILVSPTGEARGAVDPILKRHGVERRVAMTVGTYLGVPLALQNSDLTSNVPQQIAARLSKVLPLRSAPLPFRHVVASKLVWHSRNEADQAQIWLRRLICGAAQQ